MFSMALLLFLVFALVGNSLVWHSSTASVPEVALNSSVVLSSKEGLYEDGIGECVVPSGQLLFLHIMKAGGTSIDQFLSCHCTRVGCSLKLSLGPVHELHGNTNCRASAVCATHGAYKDRKELCGADFVHPHATMTAFREPVSRVFSLYNYEKEQGNPLPSISKIYQDCDAEALDESSPNGWICAAMINHMTLKTFSSKKLVYSSQMDTDALNNAKNLVATLNATFFMDDFERFPTAFRQSSVITNTYIDPAMAACDLGHSNPTECPNCTDAPTAAEVALIIQHNQMDIALYDFAASAPNRKRGLPDPPSVPSQALL